MQPSDFDYRLPDELIARYPAPERRASRLLDAAGEIVDRQFADLPSLLNAGDLLVFNDTRVIPARLRGRKASGGAVEILVERLLDTHRVLAQVRASKSPGAGTRLLVAEEMQAEVIDRNGRFFELRFVAPVADVLAAAGEVPLPPYLGRDGDAADRERYQTVYAANDGAVAAPTAGLHFDDALLDELRANGVDSAFVTLHVGAGTFLPLDDEQLRSGRLHRERVLVDAGVCEAVARAGAAGGRVVAVGTTTVRSLEAASAGGRLSPFNGETDLFIRPGYAFRCVDAMITNFHLPQSSLMMLVAAFAGYEKIMAAYRHAVDSRYRFFSYGDAMFLSRAARA